MAGKKESKDALADFFGDDELDWLDDEEEQDGNAQPPAAAPERPKGRLPVAPPPPSPRKDGAPPPVDDGWSQRMSDAPRKRRLSDQPTLVFSDVPTLPPEPAPEPEPTPAAAPEPAPAPEPAADPTPAPIAESDPEPASPAEPAVEEEAPADPEPPPAAEGDEDAVDPAPEPLQPSPDHDADADADADETLADHTEEVDEFFADGLDGDETPLVRTAEPRPARSVAPVEPAREAPGYTPPAAPKVVVEPWAPEGEREAWEEVVRLLAAEADRIEEPAIRGHLGLTLAALGRTEEAASEVAAAADAGFASPWFLIEAALLAAASDDHASAEARYVALAEQSDGAWRADALYEAARAAMADRRTTRATELLREARAADDSHYGVLIQLRELLTEPSTERAEVLELLAFASTGRAAAEAWVARGDTLAELGDVEGAVGSWRAGLEADADYTPAFLALERALELAGDQAGLAALYGERAARGGESSGWWWYRRGAVIASSDADAATEAATQAREAGCYFAERARQAALLGAGDSAALAESLAAEAAALDDGGAWLWYAVGVFREQAGDRDGALEAYQAAAADADAAPAAEAVDRVLAALGKVEDRAAFYEKQLEAATDRRARQALAYRLGELAEDDGRLDDALGYYERSLDAASPPYVLAEWATVRVLGRLERWDDLAKAHVARASSAETPAAKADHLLRAALGGRAPADADLAVKYLKQALDMAPGHLPGLEAIEPILVEGRRFEELAELHERAGSVSEDSAERAAHLYLAARLRAERTADEDAARRCLDAALAAEANLLPAMWLRSQLGGAGDAESVWSGRAAALEGRSAAWAHVAAALQGADADRAGRFAAAAEIAQGEAGLAALSELQMLAAGDIGAVAEAGRSALVGPPDLAKAWLAVRTAHQLAGLGRAAEAASVLGDLAVMDVEGRPLEAAAMLAERLEAWELAVELLQPVAGGRGAQLEAARLLEGRCHAPTRAMAIYWDRLDEAPDDLGAAWGAARVAQRTGDRESLIRSQSAVAKGSDGGAMRAVFARWAAELLEVDGRKDEAIALREQALSAGTGSFTNLRALVDDLIAHRAEPAQVRAAWESARPDDAEGLALVLERSGDAEGAAEAFASLVDASEPSFPWMVRHERALGQAEAWQPLYDALTARRERTDDQGEAARIDGRRRWLLSEKLAETDVAWDLYKSLHEESPDDREVTEALARIAGARGETALAIQYLQELATSSDEASDAARYRRRIGEAWEAAGDHASARQAFLDALDHVPDDREALAGLKRLARAESDWSSLRSVLQQEANLADGGDRVALLREAAVIAEEHGDDPGVAMDAWRGVLEVDPRDRSALEHLLALAEGRSDWATYIEVGRTLSTVVEGEERGALLAALGERSLEQHDQEGALRYLEQAVSNSPPDIDAARRLEDLYRRKADWNGVVRALGVQADAAGDVEARVGALVRAAQLEAETRHDRDMASVYYAKVLELAPEHDTALRFMAGHLYDAGRRDEALVVCERLAPRIAEGQDVDDFDVRMELSTFHFGYGEMLREVGRNADALAQFGAALEYNPSHLPSLEAVGPLYTDAGDWKKAERTYRQILQLTGGHGDRARVASTYTQLGLVERQLGNMDKAYKRFNKALEIHPNHVGALKGMALILEDRQDWSNLLNIYNNIIYHATVPQDVIDAYMTKGRILDDHMARPDKAAQHYQRSLDFDANQPAAYLRLAELAMRRDDYSSAARLAENGLRLEEAKVAPVRGLLLASVAAGRLDAGSADAPQLLDQARQNDAALGEALAADAGAADVAKVVRARLPG